MSDEQLLELEERGYHLSYLRGPNPWEASIRRRLPEQTAEGYVYAVGYGQGPLATLALADALDNVENDYERLEPVNREPFTVSNINVDHLPVKSVDLFALLANLRQPTASVFRRKL